MRPLMSWDALRVFLAVHRAGSFSAAADELGMAQSSVSEQVARLERSLGYALLNRTPSGVSATDRGAELAARIAAPADALTAVTALSEEPAERIVFVGGPAEFLSEVVLPGLAGLLPAGVRVIARFGLAEDLIEDLHAGEIDVLVSAIPPRGTDLSSEPVYDEEFVLVAHPDWEARAGQDLAAVPLLAYGPELPIIRRYWRSVFGHRPDDLAVRFVAPDLRTLLRLALGGAGMTVLPGYLVHDHLASGALVALESPQVSPLNTLYVATRRTPSHPRPVVTAVREAISRIGRTTGL